MLVFHHPLALAASISFRTIALYSSNPPSSAFTVPPEQTQSSLQTIPDQSLVVRDQNHTALWRNRGQVRPRALTDHTGSAARRETPESHRPWRNRDQVTPRAPYRPYGSAARRETQNHTALWRNIAITARQSTQQSTQQLINTLPSRKTHKHQNY